MERIIGPIRGYYIASYASEAGEAWIAYSKICRSRPESYWDAQGSAKVRSYRAHSRPEAAVADAEVQARRQAEILNTIDYSRTHFAAAVR